MVHRQSVGHPLDIWKPDGTHFPPTVTSENMPCRHETDLKSASCWQLDAEGSRCCYLVICAAHRSPRWFNWLCPKIKIRTAHRGYEYDVTRRKITLLNWVIHIDNSTKRCSTGLISDFVTILPFEIPFFLFLMTVLYTASGLACLTGDF